ncbi:hypothetical protein ACJIZ3_018121 [Penstemon smallii]|uniref:Transmembrane protein n=1 Tax=Penstemon smallii TaxID=265156 RepID=A0ABD3SXG6_9LAMI
MDFIPVKEGDVVIDIEPCIDSSNEVESPKCSNDNVVCGLPISADELGKCGNLVTHDLVKNSKKEKRKSTSAKKPPKPPRPPRGFSLDAADQKLIKEITELAMIKRARNERMKALKKMKASKHSSVSTSSSGNMIAMLFTILFCIVIIFQAMLSSLGCHSSGISQRNSSGDISRLSTKGNIIAVQDQWNLSTTSAPSNGDISPNLMVMIPGLDEDKKAIN